MSLEQGLDKSIRDVLDEGRKAKTLSITSFNHDLEQNDLFLVFDSFLDENGLIGHHIKSANNFYKNGIRQIITQGFDNLYRDIINTRKMTEEDRKIERIHCELKFTDVKLKPPSTLNYITGEEIDLTPQMALLKDKIYSGPLYISCEIKAVAHYKNGTTKEIKDTVNDLRIAKVPIITKSIMCNTYGSTKEGLMKMGEDPDDPGGYFIVKSEWAIDCVESTTFNQPKIYINEGYAKSRVRLDYIGKPGDTYENSEMVTIVFNTNDTLIIEISRDKLMKVPIPFFLVFRALGWSSDKELLDWIVFDYDSEANKGVLNYITAALNAKYAKNKDYRNVYDQTEALKEIVDLVPEDLFKYLELSKKPKNYANAYAEILETFDLHFLPNKGKTDEFRHKKLKLLALLIRKMLLVYLGHIPQTDRDSYCIKRIHAAGDNYAKAFKTLFNQTVAMPIKKQMSKVFKSTSFDHVNLANLVKSAISVEDFERTIVQTIVSGNKSSLKIKRRTITNRLAAQQLNRKNVLNMYATLRQISSPSADSAKQSERAQEMRMVHGSAVGYVCISHSPPEGTHVGINKQFALFASIAPVSSSEVLKNIVMQDPNIIPEDLPTPIEIDRNGYARVFVNGDLIGYTKDSIDLVNRYRKKRRNLEIDAFATIYWDNTQNEVHFFVDSGRMTRPLMIVYNNQRDSDVVNLKKIGGSKKSKKGGSDKFEQGLGITAEDIELLYKKKKTIFNLLEEQKIEFITPEEQQNCYIASSYEVVVKERFNKYKEFTHCDVPESLFGITALTSPFANHNQAPRVTFQTSQAKQTCGYYVGNWPFRIDKETFLQYISEMPLIRTVANKYIHPNGNNCMVAMMCYTGYNQEDSIIMNKAAIERGLFDGSKFTFYKAELEQKEKLGNPDGTKTEGIKSAYYNKVVNDEKDPLYGIVKPGTIITEDVVLISKHLPVSKGAGREQKAVIVDRSIVYKETEEAVVQNVINDRNEDSMKFVKVGLRKIRSATVGDKFCLSDDHEILTNIGWKSITEVGLEDKVATLNDDGLLEWHNPTKLYSYEHKGKMYKLENPLLDMLATTNHRMYAKLSTGADYQLIEAENVIKYKAWFKRNCINNNKELELFKLESVTLPWKNGERTYDEVEYDMNKWLTFLGIYLAEGHIDKARNVRISAHKQRVKNVLNEILPDMNIPITIYRGEKDYYYIKNHQISNYLKQFGKANDKHIPDWCKSLGPINSESLLHGLVLGDGYFKNIGGAIEYSSNSKQLADDVQILAIMTGRSATITIKNLMGEEVEIKGHLTIRSSNLYRVYISKYKNVLEPSTSYKNYTEEIVDDFNGTVYCIEVPNHVFMTRRNNKYCWTGNSSRSGKHLPKSYEKVWLVGYSRQRFQIAGRAC